MQIRNLDKSELAIVQDLAHRIWPSTYGEILSTEQMSYMLNWMYSIETLEESFESNHQFFAIFEGDNAVGFIDLELNAPESNGMKLQKIYVLPEKQGLGLGRELLDFACEYGKKKGMFYLTLQVNRFNKAVSFYRHLGFKIIDEQDFDIGNGYFMNDYVMQKSLLS
jgi:ribosomal protein S18 acetylase RimI-like enzyme